MKTVSVIEDVIINETNVCEVKFCGYFKRGQE